VQVERGDYEGAAAEVGVDLSRCSGGRYRDAVVPSRPLSRQETVTEDGRVVRATFHDGHQVTVLFGANTNVVRELTVDGKSVSPDSAVGRAALSAVETEDAR